MTDQGDPALAARRRKLTYRATRRGTREMDFLLGGWAVSALNHLSAAELDRFAEVLELPDGVLYTALTANDTDTGHDAPDAGIPAPLRPCVARIRRDIMHKAEGRTQAPPPQPRTS